MEHLSGMREMLMSLFLISHNYIRVIDHMNKRTKKAECLNASKISMYYGREEMIKLKRHELVWNIFINNSRWHAS